MIDIAIKHFIYDKCLNVFLDNVMINFNIGPNNTKIGISGIEAVEIVRDNPNLETIWGTKDVWYVFKERCEEAWEKSIRFRPTDWDVRIRYKR